jgi:hypothetical protein
LIFLARRFLFVLVVFLMRDHCYFSIFVLMYLQLFWMIFNVSVKPLQYENEKTHRIEFMNDWTIMLTNYMMLLFTDLIHNPEHKYNIGWVLIAT